MVDKLWKYSIPQVKKVVQVKMTWWDIFGRERILKTQCYKMVYTAHYM